MKLSSQSLDFLTNIIIGKSGVGLKRDEENLIGFFSQISKHRDIRGNDFPSRTDYTRQKLNQFNGTKTIKTIIESAFEFCSEEDFDTKDTEKVVAQFNKHLKCDGWQLVLKYRSSLGDMRIHVDTIEFAQEEYGLHGADSDEPSTSIPYFEVQPIVGDLIAPEGLLSISHEGIHEGISEQIAKAREKIERGDFSGAIASAYTLVEEFLKHLLKENSMTFNHNEGNINKLYSTLRAALNLNPSSDDIAKPLKPILEGLQKLVAGLYEIANKGSDRHARNYNPSGRHAQLAVNSAFTLCEFLLASHEHQKTK